MSTRTVVVCGPDPRGWRKRYWWCPVCECRTETVAQVELWYGMTTCCCRCGDSWSDGWLHPRPLSRYWRRDAVRRARRLWDLATHGPFPTLHQLDPVLFPDEDGRLIDGEPARDAAVVYEAEQTGRRVATTPATEGRL